MCRFCWWNPIGGGWLRAGGTALVLLSASAGAARLPGGDSPEFRLQTIEGPATGLSQRRVSTPAAETAAVSQRSAKRPIVSSPFGWRRDPLNGRQRHHQGIDFPGSARAGVFATGAGTVRYAGWMRGYGNLVEIDHGGGVRTRFGHMSHLLVDNGQIVRAGQAIGRMGSTGRSTGVHLHYEVRVNGTAVDPLAFVGRSGVDGYEVEQVIWAPERDVAARWESWHGEAGAERLPQTRIR